MSQFAAADALASSRGSAILSDEHLPFLFALISSRAYLRDVLSRLPSARQSDLDDLLPHNWTPEIKV